VNRKDAEGHNVFQGGFLGLDNIGVFDRSSRCPWLDISARPTAPRGWACSASRCSRSRSNWRARGRIRGHGDQVLRALPVHRRGPERHRGKGIPLWNEEDAFFYDVLHFDSGEVLPLRLRSLVGLIPLLAVETIEPDLLDRLPLFRRRMNWFLTNRSDLASLVAASTCPAWASGGCWRSCTAIGCARCCSGCSSPDEFLSPYGVRSLSRFHRDSPYTLSLGGQEWTVDYEPAESHTTVFGGNSILARTVWFPLNYLLIEALQRFQPLLRARLQSRASRRLGRTANARRGGGRPVGPARVALPARRVRSPPGFGDDLPATDLLWRDKILFYEYFNGDTGAGLGASHQTGWTALVAKLLEQTTQAQWSERAAAARPRLTYGGYKLATEAVCGRGRGGAGRAGGREPGGRCRRNRGRAAEAGCTESGYDVIAVPRQTEGRPRCGGG
jgi:hypothetical protein